MLSMYLCISIYIYSIYFAIYLFLYFFIYKMLLLVIMCCNYNHLSCYLFDSFGYLFIFEFFYLEILLLVISCCNLNHFIYLCISKQRHYIQMLIQEIENTCIPTNQKYIVTSVYHVSILLLRYVLVNSFFLINCKNIVLVNTPLNI